MAEIWFSNWYVVLMQSKKMCITSQTKKVQWQMLSKKILQYCPALYLGTQLFSLKQRRPADSSHSHEMYPLLGNHITYHDWNENSWDSCWQAVHCRVFIWLNLTDWLLWLSLSEILNSLAHSGPHCERLQPAHRITTVCTNNQVQHEFSFEYDDLHHGWKM